MTLTWQKISTKSADTDTISVQENDDNTSSEISSAQDSSEKLDESILQSNTEYKFENKEDKSYRCETFSNPENELLKKN